MENNQKEDIDDKEMERLRKNFDWLKQSFFTTSIGREVQQITCEILLKRIKRDTQYADYIMSVNDAISNLTQSFEDIKLTVKLIEFANPNIKSFKMTRVDRGDYIKYHYENYFFRLPKIKDQVLQLLNVVYRMGLSQSKGLEKRVRNHPKVIYNNQFYYLDYLEEAFSSVKPYRDIIAHRADLSTSDFAMLTSYQFIEHDKEEYDLRVRLKIGLTYIITKNLGTLKQAIISLILSLEDEFNLISTSLSKND